MSPSRTSRPRHASGTSARDISPPTLPGDWNWKRSMAPGNDVAARYPLPERRCSSMPLGTWNL